MTSTGNKIRMKTKTILVVALVCALAATTASAQTAPKMKMTTEIPPEILTQDIIETRIGTLKLVDGYPDDAQRRKYTITSTSSEVCRAFLNAMPGAALTAF